MVSVSVRTFHDAHERAHPPLFDSVDLLILFCTPSMLCITPYEATYLREENNFLRMKELRPYLRMHSCVYLLDELNRAKKKKCWKNPSVI